MKGFKILSFIIGTLVSLQVWAQTDLRIVTSQTAYQFNADGQENIISFEFDNLGPDIAVGGPNVTVTFTKDMFVDPSFGFSSVSSGDFDCTPNGDSMNCTLINTSFDPLTPAFIDLGVIIQPGDADLAPAFSVNITDQSGSDSDLSNNNLFVDIDYSGGGALDFQVTLLNPTQPIQYPEGSGTQTMDFEIRNLGPVGEGDQTTVTFDISPDLDPQFSNPPSGSSTDPNWSCITTTGQVICDYFNIFNPFTASVINLTIPIPDTAPMPATITNAVGVSMFNVLGDSDPSNNTFQYDIEITSGGFAEVEVIKTVVGGAPEIAQGQMVEYLVEVNNTGTIDATVVDLTDVLPVGVTYDSHMNVGPNFNCTYAAPTVSCTASNLPNTPNQDGVRIFAVVDGTINSTVTNTASSTFADGNSLNNSDSASFTVIAPEADLDLTIVTNPVGQASYNVGDIVTMDLTLHNPFASTGAPPNTVVSTVLPNEVVYNSAQVTNNPSWSCTHDGSGTGGVVTCDSQGNPVQIGTNTFIEIMAAADTVTAGNVSVTTSVTSDFDPNPSNNLDSVNFEILTANADLSLTLISTNGVYNQGDGIAYSVEVANPVIIPSPKKSALKGDPQDAMVTFTLPVEVTFDNVDVSGATNWNCQHDNAANGGVVTCDRGGVPFAEGSLDNITVNVIATTPATNALAQMEITSAADTNLTNNSANQADVINAVFGDFSITKTVSNSDFAIGDTFTYLLTINNPTGSAASPTDVIISDTLPLEVSYDSFQVGTISGTTVICSHDGSTAGGLFSCDTNNTPFPPGETVTIDINVTAATASTNVDNTATVETASDPDGTSNNNNDSSMTVVINGPTVTTVAATKTASLAGVPITTVSYGQTFEYVLEVQNTGANDAQNVVVTDTLPAEVTLVSIQSNGWTCGGNNTKGDFGTADVDCSLDTSLTPGSVAQIVVEVIATTNTTVSSITNTMEVNGDNTGPEVTSDETVTLQNAQATLNLSQSPSPVDPNADVDFNLVAASTGTTDLTGLQINSQLPNGFAYNGFSGDAPWSCTENAGTVSCAYSGTLTSGANTTLTLETTAASPQANQSYTLDTTLSANELGNDVNRNLTVAFSTSDVSITLFSLPQQVSLGTPFSHVIQITNSGNFDLVNVDAYYAIPEAATLLSTVSSDYNCSNTFGIISCDNFQPLTAGGTSQIELNLRVDELAGALSATASVNADGINRSSSTSTQVMNDLENDLSLTKSASVSQVGRNEIFAYQFDVINLGSETQTAFSLIDQLPSGVVFQSATGANWSCDGNNPLNCEFSGALSAGGQTQLLIDVVAPNEVGSITNTASINLTEDENAMNDTSSVAVNVVQGGVGGLARADLGVLVEANTPDVLNTEQVSWRIEVSNAGPDAAENVIINNTLPMGFVAGNVQVSGGTECTLLTSTLMCEVASLGINQTTEVILEGGFASGFSGLVMNTVEVQSDAIDSNPSNNSNTGQVTVTDVQNLTADLALELVASNQTIQQGGMVELSFMAKNLGPDRAVNATINGSLSGLIENVQLLNAGGWVCQVNNTGIVCDYPGDLQVGMQAEISFRVQTQQVVQQSQPILFNATIESDSMDTQPANNMIGFSNDVTRTPTEDEIFAIFQNSVGSSASDAVIQSIRNVSSYCARSYFMAIEGLCEEFIAGATPENGGAVINAMEELTPNEVAAQSNSAAEIITSQFRNVDSRLAQLRGGGGAGFSVAGLTGRYGNESIPIGMLSYLNQAEDEQAVSNINDFVSPWGFFVNGSISMGERDATGQELGFDFDTFGLTAGVDYRFSPTKVAGLALGYANFDSEIEGEAEMQSTGFTLTGYGSFYIKDNFYVDARISYGAPDFEQKRRINFTVDAIDIDRIATGKTDSSQYSVAMSTGYHFNKNSWNITPNASLRYVRTTIDAFQESGAGGFNFAFGEQEVESMVWSIGTSVSKAISLKNGIISPQFDINLSRETENDGGLLEARFINAPDDEIFWIGTDEPDRTYGSAGVGLVFIGANGKQAYINYRSIFGLEGFTRGTINVGARFEF